MLISLLVQCFALWSDYLDPFWLLRPLRPRHVDDHLGSHELAEIFLGVTCSSWKKLHLKAVPVYLVAPAFLFSG